MELLRLHEKHNHVISIEDLQLLEEACHFPKLLSKCARPACATCFYGKGKHNRSILERMQKLPGEISHTDIMTIPVPRLIPQMVGFLKSIKCNHSSFFVDDESDYTFVYHQESTSDDETTLEKRACEDGFMVKRLDTIMRVIGLMQ